MDLSLFDYHLPHELIAQVPARRRDESRLMVLDRSTGGSSIEMFTSVIDHLRSGDGLVVNVTRVFKARLIGHRITGGEVEIFLVRRSLSQPDERRATVWEALARPSRRLKPGERIGFGDQDSDELKFLTLVEAVGDGKWLVQFDSLEEQEEIIERHGHVPLPQYIKREDSPSDVERYQTLFAQPDKIGAVAAPTAGFHFTESLIDALQSKGVRILKTCLHVGPGTFKPVATEDIEKHTVDPEWAELSSDTAEAINDIRAKDRKVFAVGTTSVRTLESAPIEDGQIMPFAGDVDLYIKPGYKFRVVDHLITNFHLPKSSLLILLSAFAGREAVLAAYERAIKAEMRFYSYGDAMLVL